MPYKKFSDKISLDNNVTYLLGKKIPRNMYNRRIITLSQPAITCSKLTIETLEQGVKYVQN